MLPQLLPSVDVQMLGDDGAQGDEAAEAAPPPLPPSGPAWGVGVPPTPRLGDGRGSVSVVERTPGTPAYTAPECTAAGGFSGEAADVWCACNRAFRHANMRHADGAAAGRWACRCTRC